MSSDAIIVSICCVTYNHERYIRQCLDGFVMQKTNFEYEILVHEDASTDSTASILKEYEQKYPDLFRCVYQSENQFLKQNTLVNILFKMAKGKFIALCEGDDYWTDPHKLQRQVDFLEGNNDCVLCFHRVNVLSGRDLLSDYNEKIIEGIKSRQIKKNDLLVLGNFIHTNSVVFRNVIRQFPLEFKYSPVGDYLLYIVLSNHGYLYRIDDVMGVYRKGVGIHSTLNQVQLLKTKAKYLTCVLSILEKPEEKKIILNRLWDLYDSLDGVYSRLARRRTAYYRIKAYLIHFKSSLFAYLNFR